MSQESEDFRRELQRKNALSPPLDLAIKEVRLGFEKLLSAFVPEKDVHFEYFHIDKIPACWVTAPGSSKKRIILFFHGGGFSVGSNHSHRDLMARISKASGLAVLGIDYRLAPEHPYPAALEDALETYLWCLSFLSANQIIVSGISAGANLVFSLCLLLKQKKQPLPAACVALCPWVDLCMTFPSLDTYDGKELLRKSRLKTTKEWYCSNHNPKDPLISPLYGDLHGLPPTLIQIGTEILLDEAVAFADKAKASHVEVHLEKWEGMVHAWHLFAPKIPEGQEAIDHIGSFIRDLSQ